MVPLRVTCGPITGYRTGCHVLSTCVNSNVAPAACVTPTYRITNPSIAASHDKDRIQTQKWALEGRRWFQTGGTAPGGGFGMREWVDFSHLQFDPQLVKHLKLFGLEAFKSFQYIMARNIIDALGSMEAGTGKTVASKFVFHNDPDSGKSIGYILPLLHVYGFKGVSKGDNVVTSQGSTLVVARDEKTSLSLGAMIIAMNPNLECVILDDVEDAGIDKAHSRGSKAAAGAAAFGRGKHTEQTICDTISGGKSGRASHKPPHANETYGLNNNSKVLVVSVNRLRTLLTTKSAGLPTAQLAGVACVIFDDLSRYFAHGHIVSDVYRRIKSAKLSAAAAAAVDAANSGNVQASNASGKRGKRQHKSNTAQNDVSVATRATADDVHIVCIVDSLGESFCNFATEHLSGFWLYDFKNGTRQKLVGDGRTDAVRLEVDLDATPEIVAAAEGELPGGTNLPIEHSICKVAGGKSKWERIYALKCLVYHYLNLPTFPLQSMLPPMLKRPKASHQCIIFVANRSQQRHLCALECFRDLASRLGSDLTVQERAYNLNSFRNGSRPILIATDASVAGCNFDDVRYVFNYQPPQTADVYRGRAAIAGKNSNSLCVTLYSREQYSAFSNVLKTLGKRVSIHIPPSRDYMLKFNAAWLQKFANQLVELNPSFLAPFRNKAEDLLEKHGKDAIFSKTLSLLLGSDIGRQDDGSTGNNDLPRDCSLLTGRRGYVAVTVFDGGSDCSMSGSDLVKMVQRLLPDANPATLLGKYAKTESGYVIDVAAEHVTALLAAAANEPEVCFEVSTRMPKMLLETGSGSTKAKGHMNKLPWRRYKIRRFRLQKRMV
ncbi:hypothetical protein BOVATA_016740 [Babesia ovata]|uniref:ATP-dependent RNA helicase n=1 Tax=Babesia ovata TaxID=189622 RepID=A0A2H6KB06_9APIC|nr:uncharacterized protein BOVATA_016740 [Babesia ovata]GBE60181.1 hypothetical protein BOVATA_016740 [Babesia ovata]